MMFFLSMRVCVCVSSSLLLSLLRIIKLERVFYYELKSASEVGEVTSYKIKMADVTVTVSPGPTSDGSGSASPK